MGEAGELEEKTGTMGRAPRRAAVFLRCAVSLAPAATSACEGDSRTAPSTRIFVVLTSTLLREGVAPGVCVGVCAGVVVGVGVGVQVGVGAGVIRLETLWPTVADVSVCFVTTFVGDGVRWRWWRNPQDV